MSTAVLCVDDQRPKVEFAIGQFYNWTLNFKLSPTAPARAIRFFKVAGFGCHGLGVFDMAVPRGKHDLPSHGQTEDGMTVAPESEILNGAAVPAYRIAFCSDGDF